MSIRWQKKVSEGTVEGELYHSLRGEGIRVRLQVPCWVDDKRFVPDVVIYGDRWEPLALIEVKRGPKTWKDQRSPVTRQSKAYDSTGLPWRYCKGWAAIPSCVRWALRQVGQRKGYEDPSPSGRWEPEWNDSSD